MFRIEFDKHRHISSIIKTTRIPRLAGDEGYKFIHFAHVLSKEIREMFFAHLDFTTFITLKRHCVIRHQFKKSPSRPHCKYRIVSTFSIARHFCSNWHHLNSQLSSLHIASYKLCCDWSCLANRCLTWNSSKMWIKFPDSFLNQWSVCWCVCQLVLGEPLK